MTSLDQRCMVESGERRGEDADATARAWVLKLASGHATAADAAQVRAWIAKHPDHEAAFARARNLWREADALELTFRQPPHRLQRRWRRPTFAAAAAVLVAVLTPLIVRHFTLATADYHSPLGEVSSFVLADGSTLWLDSGAAIDVRFSQDRRDIELLRGRAFFDVFPNADRPFSVSTKGGTATAVGTAYSVAQEGDKVVVTVEEGRVRTTTGGHSDLLSAGEQGGWSRGETLQRHDTDSRLLNAWKTGRILVRDQPLSEAVALLDHYHPGIIYVRDRRDVRVSAQFDIHRTQQGLAALAQSQGLRISHWGPWVTVLSSE